VHHFDNFFLLFLIFRHPTAIRLFITTEMFVLIILRR